MCRQSSAWADCAKLRARSPLSHKLSSKRPCKSAQLMSSGKVVKAGDYVMIMSWRTTEISKYAYSYLSSPLRSGANHVNATNSSNTLNLLSYPQKYLTAQVPFSESSLDSEQTPDNLIQRRLTLGKTGPLSSTAQPD